MNKSFKRKILIVEIIIIAIMGYKIFNLEDTVNNSETKNETTQSSTLLTTNDIKIVDKNKLFTLSMFKEKVLGKNNDSETVLGTKEIVNGKKTKLTKAELKNTKEVYSKNYVADSRTGVDLSIFNFQKFMKEDLSISKKDKNLPKVLIINTHASEVYVGSDGMDEGVQGLGTLLAKELESYGIKCIQDKGVYDAVNGRSQVYGAYERMQKVINQTLKENPSVEVIIDIHRDGLPEGKKIVSYVDGKKTAPIMFVNGLSSLKKNGENVPVTNLKNPNIQENLAFSFQAKQSLDASYPGLVRHIYLHPYRYSLGMRGKSMLVEVGAQTNTWTEAKNAIPPLAKTIAGMIK